MDNAQPIRFIRQQSLTPHHPYGPHTRISFHRTYPPVSLASAERPNATLIPQTDDKLSRSRTAIELFFGTGLQEDVERAVPLDHGIFSTNEK
jgi:hypothetical protein